jgi:hypothetical protein
MFSRVADTMQSYFYFRFLRVHIGFHLDAADIQCGSTFNCVDGP